MSARSPQSVSQNLPGVRLGQPGPAGVV